MTEEEAKTKWCPMVKYDLGRAVNRDACYDNAGTHCIGAACMMWRWEVRPHKATYPITEASAKASIGSGHCGVAGKQ